MTYLQKISIFTLRITLGWLFFYAGITKVLDPSWSAEGYLKGAKAFTNIYSFFASPSVLPVVNFLNEWGLTLIGIALITGIGVRIASTFGSLIMILYYLALGFPYPNTHSFIVDEHIIYAAALIVLRVFKSGKAWGLEEFALKSPILRNRFIKSILS